jgi:TolA-binding protein
MRFEPFASVHRHRVLLVCIRVAASKGKTMTRRILAIAMLTLAGIPGASVRADGLQDRQIQALTERVQSLEARVARMEQLAPAQESNAPAPAQSTDLRTRVRQRFELDRTLYSQEQLMDIERLYQVANKQWDSPEAKESLKQLIDKYPKANRTGCALQYLGQMSSGQEKEKYLKQAMADFSDCYYGSGVQVGAYARFYLAHYYQETGKSKEAAALFEEIRKDYPDAVNHKGRLLKDSMPK